MRRHGLISIVASGMLAGCLGNAAAQALPAGLAEREIMVPGPVPLPGTLTVPAGKGPFAGVVLVHGSGPGDRDETVVGNKPFRDLAWGLAQQGIAVLRYDKRTKVQPMWYAHRVFTVYDETVQDALSALALLRRQPEVSAHRTFVLGHSLGGVLAPRIAKADGRVAGLIIMAGATRVKLVDQMVRQFAYIQSISGPDSTETRIALAKYEPLIAKVRAITPADSSSTEILFGAPAAYYLDLDRYDPAIAMREIQRPALVLQGMRDYQVPPDQLDDWLKAVGPRNDITVKRYPALTHLFIAGKGTPRPAEYATAGHVDPQVIVDIATWIRQIAGDTP